MTINPTKSEPEESNRMWASASFVGVLIVIGLPLWWKTTEVYRVSLPFDEISNFDTSILVAATEVTVLANDEAALAEIVGAIEETFKDINIIKLKINKGVLENNLQHALNTIAEDREAVKVVEEKYDLGQHNHIYIIQRKPLSDAVWLSTERIVFFKDKNSSDSLSEVLKQWVYQTDILTNAIATNDADASRRTRFPPGAAYHVVLSVVHPRPDLLHVDFDAGEAIEDFIGSFVDELSILHNFTLKSQWLHLLDFDFQLKEIKDSTAWGRYFAVKSERLPLVLTSLEARTATHVSEHPTLNLAFYVQPCENAPTIIHDAADKAVQAPTQAFMSPKWGGVVIGNPLREECSERSNMENGVSTYRPEVRLVMGTFLAQLRELLGIVKLEHIPGAVLAPLSSVAPRVWEVDALLRMRTIEQLTSAQLTLRSLAQLLGEISNIVINDEVGALIKSSVADIKRATELLASGDLVEAYTTSQSAFLAAEGAFVDPSLLALLYFPDDQKYAIYIPLFLPIMFPVILSLKNLLLWMRGSSRLKQKAD